MLKMTIDNEEVLSNNDISIKEEILSPSSTILNNVYPKSWELDKDYTSRFYYPKDYSKLNIQNFSIEPEEVGKTIQVNGSATLTDVDTSKESRVLRLLGQTSQTGTPTPSSPIPINVVSGDNYIDICGKNFLNDKNLKYDFTNTASSNNILKTIDKGIKYTTTLTSGTPIVLFKVVNLIPYKGKTIRMKFNYTNGGRVRYGLTNSNASTRNLIDTSPSSTTTTYQIPNDLGDTPYFYYELGILSPSQINSVDFTDMVITIDNEDMTYEPYIGNSYPIYLGVENLFDKDNVNLLNGMFINASSGKIASNANTTSVYIPINPNTTYCVSKTKGNRFAIGYSSTTPAVNVSLTNVVDDRTKTSLTSTSASDSKYLVIYISLSDTETYENIISTIQVEKGSKANSFTPYGKTPIELCKIGTYQDYIYKDNGSWYLHKEIGKVVLDGSERGWGRSGSSSNDVFVGALNLNQYGIGIYSKQSTASSWLVNRFSYGTLGALNKFNVYNPDATYGYNNIGFGISTDIVNDIDAFKTWLSNNNVEVYFPLATPTNTPIEDTTLLEQLESLSS